MRRVLVRELVAQRGRLLLMIAAVTFAVALVSAGFVVTDSARAAIEAVYSAPGATADLVVQPPAGADGNPVLLTTSTVTSLRSAPGVAAANGVISGSAQLVTGGGRFVEPAGGVVLGRNYPDEAGLSGLFPIRSGHRPRGIDEVAVDAATARRAGIHPGDRINVLTTAGSRRFTVAGLVGYGLADGPPGASVALWETAVTPQILGHAVGFDTIELQVAPGVSPEALRATLRPLLPSGATVVTGDQAATAQATQAATAIDGVSNVLLAGAMATVLAAVLLVWNTFTIVLARRTRQLALLRTLGASRRQIRRILLAESLLIGVTAAVAGLIAGIGLAWAAPRLLPAQITVSTGPLVIGPTAIMAAVLTGLATCLLASWTPIRRATRVAPVQSLREAADEQPRGLALRTTIGIGLCVLASLALATGARAADSHGLALVGLGSIGLLAGLTVAGPAFIPGLARLLGAVLRPIPGPAVPIARANTTRARRRTAATAAALVIGLCLVTALSILSATMTATTAAAVATTSRADLYLSSPGRWNITPDVVDTLRDTPAVGQFTALRFADTRLGSTDVHAAAVQPQAAATMLNIGTSASSIRALENPDTVLVYQLTATRQHLRAGDTATITDSTGHTHMLHVVGLFNDNRLLGGAQLLTSTTTAESALDNGKITAVLLDKAPGTSVDTLHTAIAAILATHPNLRAQDPAGFAAGQQDQKINQLVASLTQVLALSLLVALLSIAAIAALSLVERTRELGLLRAIGTGRAQVQAMICCETTLTASAGGMIGVTAGAGIGLAMAEATGHATIGAPVLAIPAEHLAVYLATAIAIGILAGVAPARRAARLPVLTAATAH